jgi:hypothetical protein
MSSCSNIASGIAKNCTAQISGGADDRLILINYEDWKNAVITRNVSNHQIIENIVLATGVVGYVFEGQNNSNAPKASMVVGKTFNNFNHDVAFLALSKDAATKKTLENLSKGRVVAIVQNNYKGTSGESAFEVYGGDAGLLCTAMESDVNNNDTGGAYAITLASKAPSLEPHLPATIYITDFATTKAIVDGLV